jgi:hypothetical protein
MNTTSKRWEGLAERVGKAGARPRAATDESIKIVASSYRTPYIEIDISAWDGADRTAYYVRSRFTTVFILSEVAFAVVFLALLILTASEVGRALIAGFWAVATVGAFLFAKAQRTRVLRAVREWLMQTHFVREH